MHKKWSRLDVYFLRNIGGQTDRHYRPIVYSLRCHRGPHRPIIGLLSVSVIEYLLNNM